MTLLVASYTNTNPALNILRYNPSQKYSKIHIHKMPNFDNTVKIGKAFVGYLSENRH